MKLYLVYLRRPQRKEDRRDDPFWEFGSFGITGCHSTNLLHPRNYPVKLGDRLVFLQGGAGGLRAVALTPPIAEVRRFGNGERDKVELRWPARYMPARFDSAPLFVDNGGNTEFPGVLKMLESARCGSWCARAASKLRSSRTVAPPEVANQILDWFVRNAGKVKRIRDFVDAVGGLGDPWCEQARRKGWGKAEHRMERYAQHLGNSSVADFSADGCPPPAARTATRSRCG